MRSSRFFKQLLPLLLALLVLSGCAPREESVVPLRVGMNTWPGYEPFVLAKTKKMIAGNVYISRLDSATDVIKAIRSDIIDVACVTLDEAMLLQGSTDDPIRVIAIMDFSMGADVIIARKEIASMEMLRGKRIGVESSALGSFMLSRAVDLTAGLEIHELRVVNLGYEHHEQEFNDGNIDAVVTFEPVKTKLLQGNGHVLFDSRQIPGEIIDVMVVKEKTILKKEKALERLVQGWFKSVDYIGMYPDESMGIMAKAEGITYDEFKIAYRGINVPSLDENRNFYATQFNTTIEKMQKVLLEKKLIANRLVIDSLYSDRFIRR